jgi:hypothetical protein
MEGPISDDRSEPNSPLILIPIFFNIERVLKKLTSINPPIAPIRDAGNGNNKAAMNPMAMYMLIHFRVYNRKYLLLEISFIIRYTFIPYLYYTTYTIKVNVYIAITEFHTDFSY